MSLTFPVGFKIHMKPSLFHASVTWEKPVQMVTVTATVIWQGQNAKGCWAYDLVVQFSYKSFFRFSFHQVYSLSLRPALVPQKFSFQLCLCVEQNFLRWLLQSFHSVGWHWSTTLCMTSMAWWAWAANGFVCAPHLKLSLYFLLGYNVFQRCHRRTKLTLKKKKLFYWKIHLSK